MEGLAEVATSAPSARSDKPYSKVMLYVHPRVAKKIKEIALHHDCKANDIYLKAIDRYLEAEGYGGIRDVKGPAKV